MAERKQAEAVPTDAAEAEMERQNAVAADAARMATDDAKRLDETVPGGRYRTADGRMVNANGEPIKDKE